MSDRRRRFGAIVLRTLAGSMVLSLGASLIATPASDRPTVEGEDHLMARGEAPIGLERAIDVDTGIEMVGATWLGDPDAELAVRGRRADGTWTPWTELHGEAQDRPDENSLEHRDRLGAGPAWLGHDMQEVEAEVVSGEVSDLKIHTINTEAASGSRSPLSIPSAQALPASPLVASRAQWGADESWRTNESSGCDGQPRYAAEVNRAVVHHTVNSNDYTTADVPAILRGIYYFHTHDRGWCDVAYNFFVDRFGRAWEGRAGGIDRTVIGGHTGGFNTGSTGVAVVGDFEIATVPGAAYATLRSLLAWKLAYHGVDPQSSTIVTSGDASTSRHPPGTRVVVPNLSGHRDTNNTSCPGRHLYALLPQLRRDIAADIARHKDQRITCDWDGNGVASTGYFHRGIWTLHATNSSSSAVSRFGFGDPGDRAVCGDWDGNGTETIGIVRAGLWYLRQANSTGPANQVFGFGDPGDVPVVGDWDGNGTDTPGVFRSGRWLLSNRSGAPRHDLFFGYGDPGDVPVVGDWDGLGADGIGVFRRGSWFVTNRLQTGGAEVAPFGYGNPSDTPVAGDWDGDGADTPGISRGAYWYLSNQLRASSASVTFAR